MNKTDLTTAFEQTSFLYGGNAQFIEELYARYLENPSAVDPAWRHFFATLEDEREIAAKELKGPSWKRADWPVPENGELVSALDGNWPAIAPAAAKPDDRARALAVEDVRKATLDSVRALMMIR
jgi:2-oxoglutarate dehydrogenase E1 component